MSREKHAAIDAAHKELVNEAITLLVARQGFLTAGDVFLIHEAAASTLLDRGDGGTYAVE